MDILDSLRWRYATKKFDPTKTLSEDQVNSVLDAGNLTATSYGLQPFKFVVLHNKELQEKLVTSSYGQRQVADASHVIVIATRSDVDDDYISRYVDLMESERGLDGGTLDQYKAVMTGAISGMSAEQMQAWATKQAYIALGTMMAACGALEIDACPMEGFVSPEYNEILDLGKLNLSAAVVLPIGFRAQDDKNSQAKKVRQPMDQIVVRI
ncbi:MAG: NAD(P)H-dependent oxidoreductase [Mariniblastus sp.]